MEHFDCLKWMHFLILLNLHGIWLSPLSWYYHIKLGLVVICELILLLLVDYKLLYSQNFGFLIIAFFYLFFFLQYSALSMIGDWCLLNFTLSIFTIKWTLIISSRISLSWGPLNQTSSPSCWSLRVAVGLLKRMSWNVYSSSVWGEQIHTLPDTMSIFTVKEL